MTVRAIGPAIAITLVAAACAETTVDAPETTPTSAATTVIAGDPLESLSAQTAVLGAALVDNDGQRDLLARIDTLWAGVRPQIADDRPDLLDSFDRVIALARRSVERRRPADADKAHKNLLTLIAAYEG